MPNLRGPVKQTLTRSSRFERVNDLNVDDLPNDTFSNEYHLEWAYNSPTNDTIFVERMRIPQDSVLERYFFSYNFLEATSNRLMKQANADFKEESVWLTRPKSFRFLPNGTFVFIISVNNKGGALVCADGSESIIWVSNDFDFHHSIEFDWEGNIWTCGTSKSTDNEDRQFSIPYVIAKLDPMNGKVLFSEKVDEIMNQTVFNESFRISKSLNKERNVFHLNDVQPINSDNYFGNKGDVLISLRNINTILLYDPFNKKVKWLNNQLGSMQHDVDVVNDSLISVFSNNLSLYGPIDSTNSITLYNFRSEAARSYKKESFEKFRINTGFEGLAEILDYEKDIFFVEETKNGILFIFEGDKARAYFKNGRGDTYKYLNWSKVELVE